MSSFPSPWRSAEAEVAPTPPRAAGIVTTREERNGARVSRIGWCGQARERDAPRRHGIDHDRLQDEFVPTEVCGDRNERRQSVDRAEAHRAHERRQEVHGGKVDVRSVGRQEHVDLVPAVEDRAEGERTSVGDGELEVLARNRNADRSQLRHPLRPDRSAAATRRTRAVSGQTPCKADEQGTSKPRSSRADLMANGLRDQGWVKCTP